ncbi:MAG: hypothetical protein AAFY05_27205 [Pseudomonadota bacterium]
MMDKHKLAAIILENDEVASPEMVKIEPHVRSGLIFPLPNWATRGSQVGKDFGHPPLRHEED